MTSTEAPAGSATVLPFPAPSAIVAGIAENVVRARSLTAGKGVLARAMSAREKMLLDRGITAERVAADIKATVARVSDAVIDRLDDHRRALWFPEGARHG